MIWASRNGHDTIVELLLSHGASADAVGMSNWTALLVATEGKHTKVVTKLLSMVGDGEEQGQVGQYVRRVDRRMNALPTDLQTDRPTDTAS